MGVNFTCEICGKSGGDRKDFRGAEKWEGLTALFFEAVRVDHEHVICVDCLKKMGWSDDRKEITKEEVTVQPEEPKKQEDLLLSLAEPEETRRQTTFKNGCEIKFAHLQDYVAYKHFAELFFDICGRKIGREEVKRNLSHDGHFATHAAAVSKLKEKLIRAVNKYHSPLQIIKVRRFKTTGEPVEA